MKIDVNAFLNSLPIMGVGLLGIFIVTAVIIIGIYVLKVLTAKSADAEAEAEKAASEAAAKKPAAAGGNKESAMDLLKEREKTDFLDEVENNYISHDL